MTWRPPAHLVAMPGLTGVRKTYFAIIPFMIPFCCLAAIYLRQRHDDSKQQPYKDRHDNIGHVEGRGCERGDATDEGARYDPVDPLKMLTSNTIILTTSRSRLKAIEVPAE